MTARDQHHPASSRAIATLATTGLFLRSLKCSHRWCSRWLPACPRARAAAGASSHLAAMVAPGVRYRLRWCQAASTKSWRAWVLPVLVIDPWERDWPEDDSVGTNPRYAPMVEPVRRSQSPISTANPNAVSV